MSRFMVLIHADEAEAALTPAQTEALLERQQASDQALRARSAWLDGERLRPSAEGTRVSRREGQSRAVAGPFGEALSGYCVLEAESLEAAVALAEQYPLPPGAGLEVRPVMKGSLAPGKASERGKVFAFAVLGSAPDERGWVEVMDRIDACSGRDFPGERPLAGVRLEAPGKGRRLAGPHKGGHRAVLDGPFLESKEVIGGLFFLRMTSLEEAVEWASQTAFVEHGAVEIRELWRS